MIRAFITSTSIEDIKNSLLLKIVSFIELIFSIYISFIYVGCQNMEKFSIFFVLIMLLLLNVEGWFLWGIIYYKNKKMHKKFFSNLEKYEIKKDIFFHLCIGLSLIVALFPEWLFLKIPRPTIYGFGNVETILEFVVIFSFLTFIFNFQSHAISEVKKIFLSILFVVCLIIIIIKKYFTLQVEIVNYPVSIYLYLAFALFYSYYNIVNFKKTKMFLKKLSGFIYMGWLCLIIIVKNKTNINIYSLPEFLEIINLIIAGYFLWSMFTLCYQQKIKKIEMVKNGV